MPSARSAPAFLRTGLALSIAASCALAGCAHGGARDEPETPRAPSAVQHYEGPTTTTTSWYEAPRAPPRLSETRTIGASDDAYTDARVYVPRTHYPLGQVVTAPPIPQFPQSSAPPWGVVYSAPRYGYGGPPRAWSYGPGRPLSSGGGGAPPVGGNWPAVPTYGAPFPFPSGSTGIDVTRR